MDVHEAIMKRRATRRFKSTDVDDATIRRLLGLATWAPSAGKVEGWHFVVVRKDRGRVYEAYDRGWIRTAPVLLLVCADLDAYRQGYGQRGAGLYSIQDTAAAIENLMLAATELGLATCWVGAFDEPLISKNFNLPANIRPVAIIPLGYPDEAPTSTRKGLDEVCHQDGW